ncbi:MAG: serine/threonine-protein kinase [Polyangiaceae bacterium]
MSGTERQSAAKHFAAGQTLTADDGQKFKIRFLLGTGAASEVWQAAAITEVPDGQYESHLVAIKLLLGRDASASCKAEARILDRLRDQQMVVGLLARGSCEGGPFLVLEHLPGDRLGKWISRLKADDNKTRVETFARVCSAVASLHRAGAAHLDLKPDNIMMLETASDLTARLFDLGAAALRESLDEARCIREGTNAYMSPEQAQGRGSAAEVEFQSCTRMDVFALGVILLELLAGSSASRSKRGYWRVVPEADLEAEIAACLRQNRVASAGWVPLLARALSRDPARRPSDARSFMHELIRVQRDLEHLPEPPTSRARKRWILIIALGAAVLALGCGTLVALRLIERKGANQDGPTAEVREEASRAMGPKFAAGVADAERRNAQYYITSAMMYVTIEPAEAAAGGPAVRLAHYRTSYDFLLLGDDATLRRSYTEIYGTSEPPPTRVERWLGPEKETRVQGEQSVVPLVGHRGEVVNVVTGATIRYPWPMPPGSPRTAFQERLVIGADEHTVEYPNDASSLDVIGVLTIVVESSIPITAVEGGAVAYRGDDFSSSPATVVDPSPGKFGAARWVLWGRWENVVPGDHVGLRFRW